MLPSRTAKEDDNLMMFSTKVSVRLLRPPTKVSVRPTTLRVMLST